MLEEYNELHDCGIIGYYKYDRDGNAYSPEEYSHRYLVLTAKLLQKGYRVFKCEDSYEATTLLVVDTYDYGVLPEFLAELGNMFGEESVIIIPRGTVESLPSPSQPSAMTSAFLLGCAEETPHQGLAYMEKYLLINTDLRFILTQVQITDEVMKPGNGFGWLAMYLYSKKSV